MAYDVGVRADNRSLRRGCPGNKETSLIVGGAIGLFAGLFTEACIAGDVELYASWYMPLFIIAFVAMMIIPGHILNHKARKEK